MYSVDNSGGDIIIRLCKVVGVEGNDDGATGNGGLRIQVRFDPEDNLIGQDADLPYAFPLLPKMLHVNPKVGETVLVILSKQNAPQGQRFYIGPVISQPYFMKKDYDNTTARSLLTGKQKTAPYPNPKNNPDNEGTLPDREDIAILGRENADIILKPGEIRMVTGSRKQPDAVEPTERLIFNDKDLGYIQMAYDRFKDPNNGEMFSSVINMVADRINLLSHDSVDFFNLTDREKLINKDELERILQKAHPVIYGDTFMKFFDKVINIIKTHTHPYPMVPPALASPDVEVLSTDTKQFLSNSIRVN